MVRLPESRPVVGDRDTTTVEGALDEPHPERIPGAELHVVPNEGHLSLVHRHSRDVLRAVADRTATA